MATASMTDRAGYGRRTGKDLIKRRDFLYLTTAATTLVGSAAGLWPLVELDGAFGHVLASGGPVDVDLTKLAAGEQKIVPWRSKPMFVLHRTPQMLDLLREKSSDLGTARSQLGT